MITFKHGKSIIGESRQGHQSYKQTKAQEVNLEQGFMRCFALLLLLLSRHCSPKIAGSQ
jgi:hypothetical protein